MCLFIFAAYCSSTTFKAEQEVKGGHKKGITHAMTLSIKQYSGVDQSKRQRKES